VISHLWCPDVLDDNTEEAVFSTCRAEHLHGPLSACNVQGVIVRTPWRQLVEAFQLAQQAVRLCVSKECRPATLPCCKVCYGLSSTLACVCIL